MSIVNNILSSNNVESALSTLKALQTYEQNKRTYGVNRVELYVEDVEGDWLEEWSDEDSASSASAEN